MMEVGVAAPLAACLSRVPVGRSLCSNLQRACLRFRVVDGLAATCSKSAANLEKPCDPRRMWNDVSAGIVRHFGVFRPPDLVNGVQEVGGSNPLAPILSPIASITCEGNLVSFRALWMPAARLNKEISPFSACRGLGLPLPAISIEGAVGDGERATEAPLRREEAPALQRLRRRCCAAAERHTEPQGQPPCRVRL
jgi:hypothetical protein